MDVCLMIEGQENVTWEQWIGLALACEEYGFQALFRSDHYLSFGHPAEYGSMDAWATLSALADRPERIRLGALVSPVTFRHPSELAKVVITVDHAVNPARMGRGRDTRDLGLRVSGVVWRAVGQ